MTSVGLFTMTVLSYYKKYILITAIAISVVLAMLFIKYIYLL